MSDDPGAYERVRVLVETEQRAFTGTLSRPVKGEGDRLSDYLNAYDRQFLCLTDVQIAERGQAWRVADSRDFLAVAVASITYVVPLREGEG